MGNLGQGSENDLWQYMPRYKQKKKSEIKRSIVIGERVIYVRFESMKMLEMLKSRSLYHNNKEIFFNSVEDAAMATEQKITEKTKSIWFPFKPHSTGIIERYFSSVDVSNKYPVYIVSKGRSKNGLTTKALHKMGVKHFIVVEENEVDAYLASKNESAEVITLPRKYIDLYETCDGYGTEKSTGPGPARNFCIDHSLINGFPRHWVMDDNLDAFHYLTDNKKVEVECPNTLAAAEWFVDCFANVPVSGFNYYSFAKACDPIPPYVLNTRIYSCLLIDNHSGYRWRGRYNEDTDLSLRVLKDGHCTIQFNAFLCGKVTTQRMKGGNTADFYAVEGTLPKSEMLASLHPDVASVVWRFNRWHHHVDYRPFKVNRLIKSQNPPSACDFSMFLKSING